MSSLGTWCRAGHAVKVKDEERSKLQRKSKQIIFCLSWLVGWLLPADCVAKHDANIIHYGRVRKSPHICHSLSMLQKENKGGKNLTVNNIVL